MSHLPVVLEYKIIHRVLNDESRLHIWCMLTWQKIKTRNASETNHRKTEEIFTVSATNVGGKHVKMMDGPFQAFWSRWRPLLNRATDMGSCLPS